MAQLVVENATIESLSGLQDRDFINLMDFTAAELEALLDRALLMKQAGGRRDLLAGRFIGLLFTLPSTRTRISFQAAAHQLGAHAEHCGGADLQIVNQESLVDTAAVMSRYFHALVVRMYDMDAYGEGRRNLLRMAEKAAVPLVNALDDKDHPCQVMSDLLTLRENFGPDYKRRKLLMTWGYSKRLKSPGVLHSMLTAGSLLGIDVRFAHPKGYELDEEYVDFARRAARASGARIEFCNDLREACEGVDAVYVKNWKSLSMPRAQDEQLRASIRDDWCVGVEHMRLANPGAVYMDCMPFIRGEQVTAEVADGEQSIIYGQAENRLHFQKALLASLLRGAAEK
jgi:ornithine carbamoyltransferase